MRPDTLVMVEWYDSYIPPRHHAAITTYANALEGVEAGWTLLVSLVDPEMEVLICEQTPPQRAGR